MQGIPWRSCSDHDSGHAVKAPGERVQGAIRCAAMGAAFGFATLGAEEVLHWALRHPSLRWDELLQLLPFYVGLPALAGAGIGAAGFRGVAAALWGWAAWMAILLTGAGFAGLGFAGVPMVVFGALAAVVVLLFLTRKRDELRWGALVGGFAWGIGVVVLNNSGLGTTFSIRRTLVNVGLVIIGAALMLAVGKALERFDREPRPGAMAFLLGVVLWLVKALLPNPTAIDLPGQASAKHEGPPVLVVAVDGLRADHIGYFGYDRDTTPFLDGLARRSVTYEHAYASAPWSLPALASAFTGLYPEAHGAGQNPNGGFSALAADKRTVGEYYKDAGYVTALVVTRPEYGPDSGLGQGFDYHSSVSGLGHTPALLATLDMLHVPILSVRSHPGADVVTDKALDFLGSRTGPGWLLVVQYSDLLGGTNAPGKFHRDGDDAILEGYDAELRFLDAQIKRLVRNAPKDAWVVVVGTYGVHLGERGPVKQPESGGELFQENTRVPLIVFKPRNLKPVTVVRNVRTADVLPTLVEVVGGSMRIRTDGEVLHEVFGFNVPSVERPAVTSAVYDDPDTLAVRSQQYKLIWRDGGLELYDIAMDPGESTDIVGLQPDIAERMSWALPGVTRPVADEALEDVREHLEDRYDEDGDPSDTGAASPE